MPMDRSKYPPNLHVIDLIEETVVCTLITLILWLLMDVLVEAFLPRVFPVWDTVKNYVLGITLVGQLLAYYIAAAIREKRT